MSELTKEQFEELPDFAKSQYIKDGEGYSHKGMMKVKQTANDLDDKLKEVNSRFDDLSKSEKEKIETARQEAYDKAKAENDVEAIESRWKEKYEDLERRNGETKKEYEDRIQRLADKSKSAVAADLADISTDIGKAAFKRLIKDRIQVDPETDEVTYLDEDGRATSLDKESFIAELKKDVMFMPLIKSDIVTNGGGKANGSNGGRAPEKRAFNEMKAQDLVALRKSDPSEYERLKNEFYN